MDVLPVDRRRVRLLGNRGRSRASEAAPADGEPGRSRLDEPEELLGIEFDDGWPPHFGAARVGIP